MTNEDAIRHIECVAKNAIEGGYDSAFCSAKALILVAEALKAQPCERCVSIEAVDTLVDELARAISDERCCISRGRSTATIMKDILDLPLVTPKQRWIPVSERLPEESLNCVLGWDDNRERCVFVQYVNGRFQFLGRDSSFKITAWMPLPEPYKAESEEKRSRWKIDLS